MNPLPINGKTAFLVFGPESSGNRFWMKNLVACGCAGSGEIDQPWDSGPPAGELVAWRKSFPHGGEWTNIPRFVAALWGAGYEVRAYMTNREWHSTALSQIQHKHVCSYENGTRNLRRAHAVIASGLSDLEIPWLAIQYEQLGCLEYRTAMLAAFGLSFTSPVPEFAGQNAKYYAAP